MTNGDRARTGEDGRPPQDRMPAGPVGPKAAGEAARGSVIPGSGRAPGSADLYMRRAMAEARDLSDRGISLAGTAFPQVLLLKGQPGPAELSGGRLLSGPDGVALKAALDRLGYADDAWGAASTYTTPGFSDADPADVALAVETFDPEAVVALDGRAAGLLAAAWGLPEGLPEGVLVRVRGRRAVALGGFEAALSDMPSKQLMWARLKLVPALGAPL